MATMGGLERMLSPAERRRDSRVKSPRTLPIKIEATDEKSLSRIIECEIIPRLMAAHDGDIAQAPGVFSPISAAEVEHFAPLSLQVEADELLDHVDTVLARGVSVDSVLIDLLAPAARLLGEYWKQDRCDFVDVTMGLWRLQEVVHEISGRLPADRLPGEPGKRALFAAMPGDQHSFGTLVVEEFFARSGWITDRLGEPTTSELLERVSNNWFDLVGLTVSCDRHVETLPSVIVALRNVARNPRLCVMVGGRVFGQDPDLALAVGADGTAADARLAVGVATALVGALEYDALNNG